MFKLKLRLEDIDNKDIKNELINYGINDEKINIYIKFITQNRIYIKRKFKNIIIKILTCSKYNDFNTRNLILNLNLEKLFCIEYDLRYDILFYINYYICIKNIKLIINNKNNFYKLF